MIINHNIAALNTIRQLGVNSTNTQKSLEKLSSGLRINSAADDAAGLAISEKMRGQIRGLDMAQKNAQDGISLIQTAEGALNETHSILQRMRELAVQASSDTNTADDRAEIQKEIDQLTQEVDRIGNTTEFNTKKLLNGGAGITTNFDSKQVNNVDQDWISIVGGTADTQLGTDLNITAATKATAATSGSISLNDGTGTVTTAGTLKLNGYSIDVAAGLTATQLTDLVNQYSDYTGVTATAGATSITFNTKDVGSSAKLNIEGISDVIDTTAGSNTSTTFGSDATIASTDLLTGGSYVAHGNNITITSGDYKGLELKINANVASDTGSQNTAQFDITQNGSLQLQIGANEGQNMSISIGDMRAAALGVDNIDVTTQTGASDAITTIDDAIKTVSAERARLGAFQNRLEHTINNLGTSSQNLTAAESRIRDVDMAKEMSEFTKNNILNQAAQAMLAQANNLPQGVLQLLR